uniref:Endonuclease/exonuclease/phosphatase domain-containing protein n=1 Tax=Amphilophus citrinellus TaxID=61819 RepID=A0A3Q0S1C9_AMPCI
VWRGYLVRKRRSSYNDTDGRFDILLGNVDAPNVQDKGFCTSLYCQLAAMDCINIIMEGDFNCALCPQMDGYPSQIDQSKKAKALLKVIQEFDLLDVWRQHNPLRILKLSINLK